MPVKTGIKFAKTFVLLTPISLVATVYATKASEEQKTARASNELISSGGKALALGTNYRSEPDLIKFFNKVFDLVMRDAQEPFEAEFEALKYRDPIEYFKNPNPNLEKIISIAMSPKPGISQNLLKTK